MKKKCSSKISMMKEMQFSFNLFKFPTEESTRRINQRIRIFSIRENSNWVFRKWKKSK